MNRTDPAAIPAPSWVALAVVAAVAFASAVFVAITPAGEQTELSQRTWQQFAAGDPEVAARFSMQLVLVGVAAAAFSLIALVIVLIPYRAGLPWAWATLWLMPLTHGVVAARMLLDDYVVGSYYALFAFIAVAALLIPIRRVAATWRSSRA